MSKIIYATVVAEGEKHQKKIIDNLTSASFVAGLTSFEDRYRQSLAENLIALHHHGGEDKVAIVINLDNKEILHYQLTGSFELAKKLFIDYQA